MSFIGVPRAKIRPDHAPKSLKVKGGARSTHLLRNTPEGYLLRFIGPEASDMIINSVLDGIERAHARV